MYKKALCFYLTEAIRDIEREVLSRRGLLPRLLSALSLSAKTEDKVEEFSEKINELISSDPAISEFREDLKELISNILPLADGDESIFLRPIPVASSDILKNSELSLHISGQDIPHSIRAQGAGSQSALVLSLYEANIKRLGVIAPILGVEEPKAHLHPHAFLKVQLSPKSDLLSLSCISISFACRSAASMLSCNSFISSFFLCHGIAKSIL